MAKDEEMTFAPKDFHIFLKAKMGRESKADFAAKLGVTPQALYLLLAGKREPGPKLLDKLDLEKEVVYRVKAGKPKK